MPIISSSFSTPFYLQNKQVQTIYPALFRKQTLPIRENLTVRLDDGDIIELDMLKPATPINNNAVLLIHGLTGNSDSQYIIGLQKLFKSKGVMSIAMNFRGAKNPNNLALGYHSGSSDDILRIANHLKASFSEYNWHAMGFSLGGNVLLKFLGENPNNIFHSAKAVSVPFKLDICSTEFDKGFSKIYRNRLLKQLRIYLIKKHQHLLKINVEQAKILESIPYQKKFNSFWDFDNDIIAPIYGFHSAQDYYDKCSSHQFLKSIKTPTHIINAIDDPFLSHKILPEESELSDHVTLELSTHGGHVGFYQGNDQYYIEQVVLKSDLFNAQL